MREVKLTCNRCGNDKTIQPTTDYDLGGWVGLSVIGSNGYMVGAHLCETCFVAIAEILSALPDLRQRFGALTSHAATVKCGTGDARVLREKCCQVTDQIGNGGTFMTSQIVLERPSDWQIHAVQIGNCTVRRTDNARGALPGTRFADVADNGLDYVSCGPGMDFVVIAEYVGNNPEGGKLAYTVHGRRVGFAPAPTTPNATAGDPR